MNPKLGVFVLTKDSEKYLDRVLSSLKDFSEVSIYDGGSKDLTLEIAKKYSNVKIHQDPVWTGFGDQYQKGADSLSTPWVFKLDSDEVLSIELIESLKQLDLSDQRIIYRIKRLNHYRGQPVRVTAWAKDAPLRIFNKTHTRFNRAQVHEVIIEKEDSTIKVLEGKILHYPYDSISSLIKRTDHYATLFAAGNPNKNLSALGILFRFCATFFKNYILKQGFRLGRVGLLISFSTASGTFYKYMKVAENSEPELS